MAEVSMGEVKDLLIGRTVRGVTVWVSDYSNGAEIKLLLDNDRSISISSWGHDWWGLNVEVD